MLSLRPYQEKSLESLRDGFRHGHKRQILYMPCGGGKTESAISLLLATAAKGNRAAMVMDRRVLVDQTSARLDKYGIEHGVLMSGSSRWRPQEKIQICSAQTLEKCDTFPELDLIIVDECFPPYVEILTEIGFIKFSDLDEDYLCAQYDKEEITFVKPTGYINKQYSGNLISFKSDQRCDIAMTPGHELLVSSHKNKWEKIPACDVKLGGEKIMAVAGFSSGDNSKLTPRERLSIVYQADGSLHNVTKAGSTLAFQFVKDRKIERFIDLMLSGNFRFSECKPTKSGKRRFMVYLEGSISKLIKDTFDLKSIGFIKAREIIDEMVEWDGHKHSQNSWYYSSTIKSNTDFYQCISVMAGYKTNMTVQHDERSENFNDVYRLFITKDKRTIGTQRIKKTEFEYTGNVHCVRVPSGNIIVRHNGKVLVTGNCHGVRKKVTEFIKSTGIRSVGLSASPVTKGLGSVYENVICEITTSDLVDNGYLVPLRVFIAKEIDMTGAKKVAGEWAQNEVTERGIKITGDIVTEWVKKTYEIFNKPEKTFVFCAGVAHGADLQRQFNESGHNFISISYQDDDDYKQEVMKEFSKPDSSIIGVIATDILSKGVDIPDVKIGISARPFTKSFSSHIQQIGRIMRPCEGKEFGVILDHSGNYLRFKDDWEDLYHNGVSHLDDGKEKPKPEPSDKEKEAAKCPKCSALWPPKSDICSNCGHVRERKNDVIVKAGELVEIGGATVKSEKYSSAYKESFYQQLLKYAKDKGHKEGSAYWKYKEKFGVGPPWKKIEADFVSKDVLNFITSLNIKNAHRKK